jgi:transcriptional regulator with XRE-family HTH domain
MFAPEQSRAARGLLDWSQQQLADTARVGLSTVRDFEKKRRTPVPANLAAIQSALEAAGVEFIPENGGGVGVRLRNNAAQGTPT